MFALRNKGGKPAVEVLVEVFKARSALIKHEVAYVLGQVGHGLVKGWARLGDGVQAGPGWAAWGPDRLEWLRSHIYVNQLATLVLLPPSSICVTCLPLLR